MRHASLDEVVGRRPFGSEGTHRLRSRAAAMARFSPAVENRGNVFRELIVEPKGHARSCYSPPLCPRCRDLRVAGDGRCRTNLRWCDAEARGMTGRRTALLKQKTPAPASQNGDACPVDSPVRGAVLPSECCSPPNRPSVTRRTEDRRAPRRGCAETTDPARKR